MNKVTVAVTGASGAIYAIRTLRALMLLRDEGGFQGKQAEFAEFLVEQYGEEVGAGELRLHQPGNMAATIASGSAASDGMVVVPCSMKTLSGIAHGTSGNLIERAADVTLKERRPLILVPRETPMNLLHLRNMVSAAEAGAAIVPAMPAFYQNPKSFEDLADSIAGRVLNLLGIPHRLFPAWEGRE